jgi:aryl-alcohol dehydrogenase-like predicted oxidoreductase
VLITKVGSAMGPGRKGLAADYIPQAAEASLGRLGVEAIDVYLSHWPDPETPYEETLGAYAKLIAAGKVRAIGASNLDAAQLGAALIVAKDRGLPRYEVLQPEYNLYDRGKLEGPLLALCRGEGLGVITYFSLAKGFLSGKYRGEADLGKSPRGGGNAAYLNPRGFAILGALDAVALNHGARPAEVALAWVMAKPGVTAPIASATTLDQMASLVRATELRLADDEIAALDAAGA